MSGDMHNTEWIVAEVLRRLEKLVRTPGGPQPQPTAPETQAGSPRSESGGQRNESDLVIAERVVSLATIGERLAGKKRLLVQPKAVVTPAVRDELRKRGVRLERTTETERSPTCSSKLMVTIGCSSPAAERLAAQARQSGCDTNQCSDAQAATKKIGQHLREDGATAVWLSNTPLLAQTLANRDGSIRACVAHNVTEVQSAITAIGTNLVVVDPDRVTEFQWKQIVAELRRNANVDGPSVLKPKSNNNNNNNNNNNTD